LTLLGSNRWTALFQKAVITLLGINSPFLTQIPMYPHTYQLTYFIHALLPYLPHTRLGPRSCVHKTI
jgi:hypothetical protein